MAIKIARDGSNEKKIRTRMVGWPEVMEMIKNEKNEKHGIIEYTCQQANEIQTNL